MLVPPGKPVYENLATSYVLLDALIGDLCDGGFSGIVEVILRDADCHVVINRGQVAGTFERSGDRKQEAATISDLAARARSQRGRVSVYKCSIETAEALAGCAQAEPLYTKLSTEFADIERMISKLGRERDREWFIEIYAEGSQTGLIHIQDGTVWAFSSRAEGDSESIVKDLISECNAAGGVFDVYFRRPVLDMAQTNSEDAGLASEEPSVDYLTPSNIRAAVHDEADFTKEPSLAETRAATGNSQRVSATSPESPRAPDLPLDLPDLDLAESVIARPEPASAWPEPVTTRPEPVQTSRENGDSGDRKRDTGDALSMAAIKHLMGEIAGTMEKSVRAIEPRDTFAMYLRAGQLKIADRYPFLDPFGAEFEYMTGEIAFVGKASPTEFIDGMTEALRLAMNSITDTSSHPTRLRARVSEDLHGLLEARKEEFEPFGLDHAIEWILR